jgi:alpha-beta hydrolase superfamily lysophospholipase
MSNLLACTPMIHPAKSPITTAHIDNKFFTTVDGTELPLKKWQNPHQEIENIIIAIHGFNDYSQFFHQPGVYFSQHNTLSYAYDQRGFGKTQTRGLWAGVETYISDLQCFIQLIRNQYPSIPIFLLGESMGGAIVISTATATQQLPIDGIILVAPAVWGRQTMPWYQNVLLWTLSHAMPWLTLTGKGLNIQPSDNIEMLRALSKDPWVIKATRIESLYGLTNLMGQALSQATLLSTKTLLLYGEKDQIIPKEPTYQFLQQLKSTKEANQHTIAIYENGYHMLLRDLQAPLIWNDIKSWISNSISDLPSGADKQTQALLDHTGNE